MGNKSHAWYIISVEDCVKAVQRILRDGLPRAYRNVEFRIGPATKWLSEADYSKKLETGKTDVCDDPTLIQGEDPRANLFVAAGVQACLHDRLFLDNLYEELELDWPCSARSYSFGERTGTSAFDIAFKTGGHIQTGVWPFTQRLLGVDRSKNRDARVFPNPDNAFTQWCESVQKILLRSSWTMPYQWSRAECYRQRRSVLTDLEIEYRRYRQKIDPTIRDEILPKLKHFHEMLAEVFWWSICTVEWARCCIDPDWFLAFYTEETTREVVDQRVGRDDEGGSLEDSRDEDEQEVPDRAGEVEDYIFRKEGDTWTVCFEGKPTTGLQHLTGMLYIRELLGNPHKPIPCLDLRKLSDKAPDGESRLSEETDNDTDNSAGVIKGIRYEDRDNTLDDDAVKSTHQRLVQLRTDLDKAKADGDEAAQTQIRTEIEKIQRYLASGQGLQGRLRKFPDKKDRARTSVRRNLTRAWDSLKNHDKALAAHLRKYISTGTSCTYSPDEKIVWRI